MLRSLVLNQCTTGAHVDDLLRRALVSCWLDVSNAGGAVGFPVPPVPEDEVVRAVDALISELHPDRCRLLTASDGRGLAGWLVLHRDPAPLVAHRASVHRVQSRPERRGEGVGTRLMTFAREVARDELGVEQLQLTARSGMGLEEFYAKLGWREVGRWPGALRIAPGDDRDEILLHLPL
ncbi:N-acetyltransferase family protein [Saccharopolyspora sp. CA-218241]|uniref:GNAT family N-acetyltransferase n=1 Tax=Saccharopolyspora sp. CA-218241 TaxID=3240027 RepID=UPI003D96A602